MRGIGIIGRARTGKDTLGARLVRTHGFGRVAFADALKDVALILNPIVAPELAGSRLADVVAAHGWDGAKDLPEVRRVLQHLGQGVRAVDREFWVRAALHRAEDVAAEGHPVVFTDVRYENEARAVRDAGFALVHIDRPGVPRLTHESEGALDADDADYVITNDGTLADLHAHADMIAGHVACFS